MTELHLHQHKNFELPKNVPSDSSFINAAEMFQLINDPTRLKILWFLCHNEICVNNIAITVNISPPLASHHLRLLKQAKLLESSRHGKEVYYKLANTEEAILLRRVLDNILSV